jgi:hypothetical protein
MASRMPFDRSPSTRVDSFGTLDPILDACVAVYKEQLDESFSHSALV